MVLVMAWGQRIIVVVSGPVAGGKSALARELANRFSGLRLSTRDILMTRLREGTEPTRAALQLVGEELDRETGGTWVADRLGRKIFKARERGVELIIVDAARIAGQIDGLRDAFGREVCHVHITASAETCAARYAERQARQEFVEAASYAEVRDNATERNIDDLAPLADIALNTDRDSAEDVLVRVAARLGLLDRENAACVDVIVGGQYGSEGKGNIAYHLAPEYDLLVRVGGPNAAHKVPLASGEYTHFMLPSGTLAGTAQLLIGAGAVIFLPELFREIADADIDYERLSVDPQVMIIEDYDKVEEKQLRERIASTASGAGEATARRVLRGDGVRLASQVPDLEPYVRPSSEIFERAYAQRWRIMLEGTQGSALSLYHGFYPHVTSRDSNVAGCLAEAGIAPARVRRVVMVVRSYPIRVGGPSGPMTREISWEKVERRAELPAGTLTSPDKELTSKTKTKRRVGEFEWDSVRRAALLNAPTDIALTFADYIHESNARAWRFEQLTRDTLQMIDELERVTGARVSLISTGFMQYASRRLIDRREW
jgi:adenylosuccinate synthase